MKASITLMYPTYERYARVKYPDGLCTVYNGEQSVHVLRHIFRLTDSEIREYFMSEAFDKEYPNKRKNK